MNLNILQVTDKSKEYPLKSMFMFRLLSSLFAFFIVLLIVFIIPNAKFDLQLVILLSLWRFIESQIEIFYGCYERVEDMKSSAYSKLFRGFANIMAMGIGMILFNKLSIAIILMILFNFFIFVWEYKKNIDEMNLTHQQKHILSLKMIQKIIVISLPLAISNFLDSFSINLQRIILSHYTELDIVGYFTSLTFIMIAGQTIFSSIGRAFLPRLSSYHDTDFKRFKKIVVQFYLLGVFLSLAILLMIYSFGSEMLSLLYTKDYENLGYEFILIMIAGAIWYSAGFLNISVYATRKFKNQFYVYLVSFIVFTSSTYLLLENEATLKSVAIALILGMLSRKVMLIIVLVTYLKDGRGINYEKAV
jgi:O-antigen/teichoic acid export membrane protein